MDRIVGRFGSSAVLHTCLLLAAVRWVLIGSASTTIWLVLGQVLHAATYAAFHVAAIREVYLRFGRFHRAKGQAMYSGMTYGLGLFLGSLGAGWLANAIGLPTVFLVSAGVALLAIPVLGDTAGD
jgi:PPP family 3-phenylpropionic acid transporter